MTQQSRSHRDLDAVVVGAGFAGLYMLHRLRGLGLRARVFEAGGAIGGLGFFTSFADLIVDPAANETAAEFVRAKTRGIVRDPAVAEALSPKQVIGWKCSCVDTGYYATFNRSNVTLVDVAAAPIEEILPDGLRTSRAIYALDALVFATGFDAMTGALHVIDIRGEGGLALREKWAEGPRTYLGLGTAGFPNLFLVTGPGSPSVLSNMVPSIEQHVNWIADCIGWLRGQGRERIEATPPAEEAWGAHVNEVAAGGYEGFVVG